MQPSIFDKRFSEVGTKEQLYSAVLWVRTIIESQRLMYAIVSNTMV